MEHEPFDSRLTFLVYRVTAKLTLVANRLFRQHGLDIYSSRILLLLLDVDDRAVGELVDTMALPQSTVSPGEAGLRRPAPRDGRQPRGAGEADR